MLFVTQSNFIYLCEAWSEDYVCKFCDDWTKFCLTLDTIQDGGRFNMVETDVVMVQGIQQTILYLFGKKARRVKTYAHECMSNFCQLYTLEHVRCRHETC